jgi:Ricin-type beta-trefoil lectin domain-like
MSTYYFIKSKLNGNVIDIANASTTIGASLDSYPQKTTGTDNQLWEFVVDPAGSRYYFTKSKLNGNVIDIANASKASGASLDSWPQKTTGYQNQLWGVVNTAGSYVLPPPQPKFAGSQSLISTSDGSVYGFVIGDNGHVYEWAPGGLWYDLGTPPGSQATCLAALYPPTLSGPLAFVIGGNGHLYNVLWSFASGANPLFAWNDQGAIPASVTPSGAAVNVVGVGLGNPAMVSTVYQPTTSEIFAFVMGYDQNLYDCHLAGTDWIWEAHGAPTGTSPLYLLGSPVGAVYDSATDQIFVFVLTEDGHLWNRHGSGMTWEWYDHGVPAGSPKLNLYPCAVFQPSSGQILAFVTASNGHVYCSNWTGTAWVWSDLGTPPGTSAGQAVAAVCDPSSDQISVFVVGGGHLYLNQRNGTTWGGWQDTLFSSALGASALATPGYFSVVSPLTVLANLEAIGSFPLAFGFFAAKTKKWVWASVGLPTL